MRTRAVPVRVRFVELSRERIEVECGQALLGARADGRADRIAGSSRVGAESGRREVLVLRAPEEPGTYNLYVTVGGRAARAEVVVLSPE